MSVHTSAAWGAVIVGTVITGVGVGVAGAQPPGEERMPEPTTSVSVPPPPPPAPIPSVDPPESPMIPPVTIG